MMGRTHAATGILSGLLVGQSIGLDEVRELGPFVAVSAGYALFPDLDHPGARASRLLGPVTGAVSWGLRKASGALYQATKGPRDERCKGTHRHLSHTLLFALLVGGVCAVSTASGGPWVVAGWVVFGLLLAANALGLIALAGLGVAATAWLPEALAGEGAAIDALTGALAQSQGWLGIAVALGCFTHCLGDALTESGCPFLFPIPIAGETWYELRPPSFLRFRTGKTVESKLIFPAVVIGCVAALPGLAPFLLDQLGAGAPVAGGLR